MKNGFQLTSPAMADHRADAPPMMEALEGRTFLSVTVAAAPPSNSITTAGLDVIRKALASVTGLHLGKLGTAASAIVITSVNNRGQVTGTITSTAFAKATLNLTGTLNRDGSFTLTFNQGGYSGTLTGELTPQGGLKGSFILQSPRLSVEGTMLFGPSRSAF